MAGLRGKASRFWKFGAAFRQRFGWVSGTRICWAYADADYRLEAGKSVRYLVPDAVLTYIQLNGLYQNGA
mgnify:CR=1 FL=1